MDLQQKWNQRYRDQQGELAPATVLRDNMHLLPAQGRALDLACGRGANAMLMARHGLEVEAWDLSDVAIGQLRQMADTESLPVHAQVRDVEQQPPDANHYDVITVCYFLDRPLVPALISALRPGGLIFYETFSQVAVSERGPGNPDFRLAEQELLTLFGGLLVRVYREEGRCGDIHNGTRDVAMLVAQKPSAAGANAS